jgi:uncharacterized protein GlcG (DUF336 family)
MSQGIDRTIARRLSGIAVAACVAGCLVGLHGSAQAQVISNKDVGVHTALAIALAAVDACEKQGFSISVTVINRAGQVRAAAHGDRSPPHNIELSKRKAYTALTFRRTSADWAKRTEGTETAPQRELSGVIALRGGIPIKVGDEVIGGVGVSGSQLASDEGCAIAGLESVASQLK